MNSKLVYVLSAILMMAGTVPLQAISANDRTAGEVVDDMSIAPGSRRRWLVIRRRRHQDRHRGGQDMVQLNGFVDTEAERSRAEEIASSTEGVASVTNNLRLQPHDRTTGEYVDDKTLVAEVKAALASDPNAPALSIDVEADHGVVSLGGHVNSEEERTAALEAARRVAGVQKVITTWTSVVGSG
jgi:hyperosmotically inducible protein